ncbi:TOMM precursor leader peptide-binding protein [Streptomyces sp. NPDC057654]|uniref:TOMM precursor leader peptide-binding protein n=1 Tax=Streptomyces sp. NPDC057654 TaxID=3346196 RepID=UPI00367B2EFF
MAGSRPTAVAEPPRVTEPWAAAAAQALYARLAGRTDRDLEIAVLPLGVRDELAAAPPAALGAGDRPVAPVYVYGHTAVLGPVPPPGAESRPCGHCLARRWQAVRHKPLRDALELGGPTRAAGEPPHLTPFALDALAALIASQAAGSTPGEGGYPLVHRLNLENLRVRSFPLVPDPQCPACDRRPADAPAPVALDPSPKTAPGSFRVRDLDDLDIPLTAFANPVCGTLGAGVARELDAPTTASTVGNFGLRTGHYLHETFWGGHSYRYGDSVRIGALEGLERYAGMRSRAKATSVVASLAELREGSDRVLDPRECGVYPDAFYASQSRVRPFSEDARIPWVWGHSLRDDRPVLVPEILTYYHSAPLEQRFVQECSNGCASGGSLSEAVYYGLMELVERDAFLLTWYGRPALPELDPHSSRDAATREMVDRLAMYGYEARFFDARMTLPVPVVVATATRVDGGEGALCFGAGASLDPEAALRAGLAEIATDSLHLRRRTEWNRAELKAMAADFGKVLALHDHPLVYGLPEMSRHAAFLLGEAGAERAPLHRLDEAYRDPDRALRPSDDLSQDVHGCVNALAAEGFDTIAVDQTLPEQRAIGLHTVSVIVPGLLPIDFGWDRQRAPHMPRMRTGLRRAGLADRDLEPADLNPAPHPFP